MEGKDNNQAPNLVTLQLSTEEMEAVERILSALHLPGGRRSVQVNGDQQSNRPTDARAQAISPMQDSTPPKFWYARDCKFQGNCKRGNKCHFHHYGREQLQNEQLLLANQPTRENFGDGSYRPTSNVNLNAAQGTISNVGDRTERDASNLPHTNEQRQVTGRVQDVSRGVNEQQHQPTSSITQSTIVSGVQQPNKPHTVQYPRSVTNFFQRHTASSLHYRHTGSSVQQSHMISSVQQPHESSSVQVPHESSSVQMPHEPSSVQVSHESSSVQVPHESSRVQEPQTASRVQEPQTASRIQEPQTASRLQEPQTASRVQEPQTVSSAQQPQAASIVQELKPASSIQQPQDNFDFQQQYATSVDQASQELQSNCALRQPVSTSTNQLDDMCVQAFTNTRLSVQEPAVNENDSVKVRKSIKQLQQKFVENDATQRRKQTFAVSRIARLEAHLLPEESSSSLADKCANQNPTKSSRKRK